RLYAVGRKNRKQEKGRGARSGAPHGLVPWERKIGRKKRDSLSPQPPPPASAGGGGKGVGGRGLISDRPSLDCARDKFPTGQARGGRAG
ncbi:MAG: hypothetical protein NTV79_04640, partial [Candidatus Aureabacteria bacterium]|nr:hypothetical protein [Candidatus Auribacterota bacterium]